MKARVFSILIIAILLLPLAACGAQESAVGVEVGQQAPDFTLELHGGGSVTLSELRGKPVVLNFFATWCGPCRLEMPDFQEIFEEYRDRVPMLGVSAGEAAVVVAGFLAESGYTYPTAYDPDAAVSMIYLPPFGGYIPQTWILDAEGVIVKHIIGGTDAETLRQVLDQTLAEETAEK